MKRAVTYDLVNAAKKKLKKPVSRKRALEFALKWSRKKWEQLCTGDEDSYYRNDGCGFCLITKHCYSCFDEIRPICNNTILHIEPQKMLKVFDEIEAKYTEWPEEGDR